MLVTRVRIGPLEHGAAQARAGGLSCVDAPVPHRRGPTAHRLGVRRPARAGSGRHDRTPRRGPVGRCGLVAGELLQRGHEHQGPAARPARRRHPRTPSPAGSAFPRHRSPRARCWAPSEFAMPTRDNLHLMDDVYVQVARTARRAGHRHGPVAGGAAGSPASRDARRRSRGATTSPTAISAPERVEPRTGVGHLPVDRRIPVRPVARALARPGGAGVPAAAAGGPGPAGRRCVRRPRRGPCPAYQVVSWVGPVPEEHLDRVAEMNRTLSVDAPTGDLDWEEEVWDAERVRHSDERRRTAPGTR